VTDSAAVEDVALGPHGIISGLSREGIYLDMSTIAPDAHRQIAAEFKKASMTMLDAPISGSTVTLEAGKASIMVGGDRDAFERVKPTLLDIGAKATYIGDNGLAVQMKLAINLVLMVEVIAFGEGIALAEKGGVVREVA
jgi:3-hydroxyisobutyrate dehydrogenase-like beta-hydroxyacid dehydrogenase